GSQGLVKTSIFAGFLIIVQNVVSVVALLTLGSRRGAKSKWGKVFKDILLNPIIIAAASGILYSAFKVYIPPFLKESMVLLSRMALPLALLVIGASISLNLLNSYLRLLSMAVLFKLVFLPALGICLLWVANTPLSDIYPAVILLSSPTATVSYVMAAQMGGDTSFSTAAISVSTAFSILTYTLWVWLMGYLPLR
ncbi:MAG: AEC family transporter, partial [Desulfatiglandales bacterium]